MVAMHMRRQCSSSRKNADLQHMPLATVIIPNFNNGRASSRDGAHDFLGDLLANLELTLRDDPTELEIVVADDGSSDDSLATARAWSQRVWSTDSRRAGQPFLRLIELPHSGVLSHVLNALHQQTEGEFICRLDGDVIIDTPRWVERCIALMGRHPNAAVMTGLQKLPDGRNHAFGDAILSPLGYHHLGQGLRDDELPPELEVEHVMGCFHVSRRAAIAAVGGYDEEVLRGQTEELAMRLNLAGFTAFATTSVVFRHFHMQRNWRANAADTSEGLGRSLDTFARKWGCDRLAPDLREVWQRWQGTPLVQRARLTAPTTWNPLETGDFTQDQEWSRFGHDPSVTASVAAELAMLRSAPGPLAILGARSGLTAMLRARDGVEVHALEENTALVAAGMTKFLAMATPVPSLNFTQVKTLEQSGLAEDSFACVALLDSIERLWNPVGVLREARRLLKLDGFLLVRTRARVAGMESRGAALHPFAAHELIQIVRHVGGFELLLSPSDASSLDTSGRWNLVARKSELGTRSVHFGVSPIEPTAANRE